QVDPDQGEPDPGVDDDALVEDAVEHVDQAAGPGALDLHRRRVSVTPPPALRKTRNDFLAACERTNSAPIRSMGAFGLLPGVGLRAVGGEDLDVLPVLLAEEGDGAAGDG